MSELNLEGMAIAPGVVETIVSIAVGEVEGVAAVGSTAAGRGLRQVLGSKQSVQGIEIEVADGGKLKVSAHIDVCFGQALPEVAERVRTAIADAVASQVGVGVAAVDVYIDGIQ
ncbi:MAG TPA: Asp23/Gls24 family envelope stress response protein [Candidatus Aphodovivens avistercoris]|nr:Asp23/Gls24 family envelope stress response protein [Candidatus Aphodovivens avistercoris]